VDEPRVFRAPLAENGHQMRRAIAEIDPFLGMADQRIAVSHVVNPGAGWLAPAHRPFSPRTRKCHDEQSRHTNRRFHYCTPEGG
jgi:hypothetical protein